MFTEADFAAAAVRLAWPISHVKAFADVESSGETMWTIDGVMLPPVRLEAHWFGKLTDYRFNDSHPNISSTSWNPSLAATTRAGAWAQVMEAASLDKSAAHEATSWGAYQIMGFHYAECGFATVAEFVADMMSPAGQMDAFVRFIESEPALLTAGRNGDWQTCETLYNGGGQGGAYAAKLAAAAAHYGDHGGLPRVMREGDVGEDVRKLQAALGIPADGVFGHQTDAAVRLFQSGNGLVVDGIVGALTLKAINNERNPAP